MWKLTCHIITDGKLYDTMKAFSYQKLEFMNEKYGGKFNRLGLGKEREKFMSVKPKKWSDA